MIILIMVWILPDFTVNRVAAFRKGTCGVERKSNAEPKWHGCWGGSGFGNSEG